MLATSTEVPGIGVQFWRLTKPRVVSLIVFTAVIGMLLAAPALPDPRILLAATVGIALVAGAAAAFNCLVEQQIDRRMTRTAWRPTAKGELTNMQALAFSACMRKHGLPDFPDPQFLSGGRVALKISAGSGIDFQSAQFQAAQKACQGLLPGKAGAAPPGAAKTGALGSGGDK